MSNHLLLHNAQVLNFNMYTVYLKYRYVHVTVVWLNMLVASVKIRFLYVKFSSRHFYLYRNKENKLFLSSARSHQVVLV
jgi:hypothetical protein